MLSTEVHDLGDRNLILEQVTPPEPTTPAPAPEPTPAELQARQQALDERLSITDTAMLSATVYDGTKTLLRWPVAVSGEPLSAWLNVNFNHFADRATVEHNGRKFRLSIGLGNIDTAREAARYACHGMAWQAPAIPAFPSVEPAVIWAAGSTPPPAAVDLIEGILAAYRAGGPQMKLAWEQKQQAAEQQQQEQAANPPQPQDIVIRHWVTGGKPVGAQAVEEP